MGSKKVGLNRVVFVTFAQALQGLSQPSGGAAWMYGWMVALTPILSMNPMHFLVSGVEARRLNSDSE